MFQGGLNIFHPRGTRGPRGGRRLHVSSCHASTGGLCSRLSIDWVFPLGSCLAFPVKSAATQSVPWAQPSADLPDDGTSSSCLLFLRN